MLTPKEAFKIGFLSRCVEDGLSLEQAHDRVKMATDLLQKQAGVGEVISKTLELPGKALDMAKPVLGAGLNWGIPLALAAPPILGGVAGYTLGKMGDVDDTDVDEIKKRELIESYKRHANALKRAKKVRDYQAKRKQTGRVFL